MRLLRKWLILVHRYLGIVLSLLFVMWFASGIAMIYAGGMPRLSPAARLERRPALDLTRVRLTPAEAAERAVLGPNPGRVALLTVMDRPAYRFAGGTAGTVFADNGDLFEDVGQAGSLAIAGRFVNQPSSALHYAGVLHAADQWTIGERQYLPLHKIVVDDPARTELYVCEWLGEVVLATTRRSRSLAWAAAIPHWLYFAPLRRNDQLWMRVVLWTSGLGMASAVIGLVLGAIQYRVNYAGWMRWHYLTGIVFGVFTVTWLFSGFLSMEPSDWFSRGGGGERIPQALSGGPVDLTEFPRMDAAAFAQALDRRDVKEIEFRRVQGRPYYLVRGAAAERLLVSASPLQLRREPFPLESLIRRIADGYPEASIVDAALLATYDAYYYDRDREAPLPVVRVKFGDADGTWVYVDGMGQLVARVTRRKRLERWLYHGLHSLDFSFWYYSRPAWDIGVIALCAGGTILSAIGVVIGFKRVRRGVKPRRGRSSATTGAA